MKHQHSEEGAERIAGLYVFSPLLNFISDVHEIRLTNNLVIALPTDEERRVVEQDVALGYQKLLYEWQLVVRSGLHLHKQEDQSALDGRDFQSGPYQCCTALRLFKEGTVGLGPQYLMYYPPVTFTTKLGRANTYYFDVLGKYSLTGNEVRDFTSFYNKLGRFDYSKYRRIKTALLRFDFSYNIALLYQLIDLMIGFEALYIADEKELGYKLATRASFLLGETQEQRSYIFGLL